MTFFSCINYLNVTSIKEKVHSFTEWTFKLKIIIEY